MSVKFTNHRYTDIFGNTNTFYRANAGDKITFKTDLYSSIDFVEDDNNPIRYDFIQNEIQLQGSKSFLDLGFRVGDSITYTLYLRSTMAIHTSTTSAITYISDQVIKTTAGIGGYFDETLYLTTISVARYHSDLEVNFNHILNSSTPTFNSLIDGEETRLKFSGINSLALSTPLNASIIGNQSGEYVISSTIELYRQDGTLTTSLFSGEIMTIKAIHTFSGYVEDSSWGMITVESFESQPRYILSTVVPFDNDVSNPLKPISGIYATKTVSTSQIEISCLLEVDKLDSKSKITSKVFLEGVSAIGFEFDNDSLVQFDDNTYAQPD